MKGLAMAVLLAAALAAQAQERPQLDVAGAARMNGADYLAQGPAPWQPEPLAGKAWRADYTVAADGSGSYTTVQAAIDAVPARAQSGRRVVILIKPGVYRERVCIQGKAPISLVGDAADASAVVIVGSAYAGLPKRPGVDAAQACQPDLALASHGTPGSATLIAASDDFQAANLTIANDALEGVHAGLGYPPGAGESGGAQGVALTTQGDRMQLEHVRLIGHQDTFHARRAQPAAAARVYVHDSLIAGDVDFIFGNATLVIDESLIVSRAGRRRPGNGGYVLAPSTPPDTALGFLVTRSRLLAEAGIGAGKIGLGRAWDEGVVRGEWQPDISPNGQALVRDSVLGPHLGPWGTSTSRRPFSATGPQANRFFEFHNRTPSAADPAASRL